MLTPEQIQPYLKGDPKTYPFKEEAVKLANKLRVHVDGVYPDGLTAKLRPHETAAQQTYRKDNFKAITKPAVNSIVVSIRKINKADDFEFTYPDMPPRIPEDQTLKRYLEEDFPFDNSLRNWLFKLRLFDMLGDPNGVVAILPSNQPKNETEYVKPYPYYFPSDRVLEFVEGNFCVLESDQKSILSGQNAVNASGRILWIIDTESLNRIVQVGSTTELRFEITTQPHYATGWMPAFKWGGGKVAQAKENGQRLHESIISPCLDYFDLALERQSDVQIQWTYQVHSEGWEYIVNKCGDCHGTGKKTFEGGKVAACPTCSGSKWVSPGTSPLGITRFTPDPSALPGQDGKTIAPPHKGYILKPLEPTIAIRDEVKANLLSAMEALNVEYAKSTPLNISGEAKKVDRQEVNGFYSDIAQHLVENILRVAVFHIACQRYGKILPISVINEIVPYIPIPNKFDTFDIDALSEQIKQAVDNEMDAAIIFELQKEYAGKEFGKDSLQYKMVSVASRHNPMPFMLEDDRMSILANGGCTKADYILSSQFNYFVTIASEEDDAFFDKAFKDQKEALYALVEEQIKEEEAKKAAELEKMTALVERQPVVAPVKNPPVAA